MNIGLTSTLELHFSELFHAPQGDIAGVDYSCISIFPSTICWNLQDIECMCPSTWLGSPGIEISSLGLCQTPSTKSLNLGIIKRSCGPSTTAIQKLSLIAYI